MKQPILLLLLCFCVTVNCFGETFDLSEPHPPVDPAVCPVCLKTQQFKQRLGPGFKGEVVVRNRSEYDAVRRMIVDSNANDVVVVIRRSDAPSLGIARLNTKPKSVSIYHDIPKAASEARLIHGDGVRFDAESFKFFRGRAYRMKTMDIHSLPNARAASNRLRTELATKTKDDMTIVIGHVDKYGKVIFHDGSSIAVAELQSTGHTWVIGCNTNTFSSAVPGLNLQLASEISYSRALTLSQKIKSTLSQPNATIRDAVLAVSSNKSFVTTTILGGILYSQTIDEEN